jgi:hypothetical protein
LPGARQPVIIQALLMGWGDGWRCNKHSAPIALAQLLAKLMATDRC